MLKVETFETKISIIGENINLTFWPGTIIMYSVKHIQCLNMFKI